MRIFKTLFAFAALISAGLMAACETDPTSTPQPEEKNPKINVENLNVSVSAEGGDYTINLTIDNPIGNVAVGVSEEAEWITIKETSQTAVVFNAAYNTEESAR